MNDNHTSVFGASAFKASFFRNNRAALIGIHRLRLVWSAPLCLVGTRLSPWERLYDRLLWLSFIAWLRHDAKSDTENVEKQQGERWQGEKGDARNVHTGTAA